MTKEELAAKLTGSEYPLHITKQMAAEAKAAGLVIVYGASDDLMEFEGAIYDEIGTYGDAEISIDAQGIMPHFDSIDHHDEQELEAYFKRKNAHAKEQKRTITALWCKENGYSWTYQTDIPHATFEVVEDGEPYCRGIVFDMKDLTNG